ncbi:hypothetical protein TRVL_07931 [Trypanosoma vivax]|nr:hypothetical protein TRVL_07931 [Trypanosoma vivax]
MRPTYRCASGTTSRTLNDALCRAFPQLPCVLLNRDKLTLVSHEKYEEHPFSDSFSVLPLSSNVYYGSNNDVGHALTEFSRYHGYTQPVFVSLSFVSTAPKGRCFSAPFLSSSELGVDTHRTAPLRRFPSISARLVVHEQRLNLTECMSTCLLQEELSPSSEELCHLFACAAPIEPPGPTCDKLLC